MELVVLPVLGWVEAVEAAVMHPWEVRACIAATGPVGQWEWVELAHTAHMEARVGEEVLMGDLAPLASVVLVLVELHMVDRRLCILLQVLDTVTVVVVEAMALVAAVLLKVKL